MGGLSCAACTHSGIERDADAVQFRTVVKMKCIIFGCLLAT